MQRTFFIILLLCAPIILGAKEAFMQKQSLCFIENKGQITEQNHNSRNDIDAKLATGNGLNIFVGRQGLHYQYSRPLDSTHTDMYRMDVELLNSNPDAKLLKEEEQYYYETYYTPPFSPDHGATAHSFKRLTYQNIYPNIDWTLYIKDNKLEYDFIVHPGGNVKDIQMRYGGANDLTLQVDGSIKAVNPMGKLVELAPISHLQESGENKCVHYCINNKRLSFNAEAYSGTLIIDPVLEWATYYGGDSTDLLTGMVVDSLNNLYVYGYTASISNIATNGAYQTSLWGNPDACLAKFDALGNKKWATYYGGEGGENSSNCVIDKFANIYLTGTTFSDSGIATSNAWQITRGNASNNAFLSKFDSLGNLVWGTYFGSAGDVFSRGLAIDTIGSLYITGSVNTSLGSFGTPGVFHTSFQGGSADAYLAKFSNLGSLLWATYYGGPNSDIGYSVTTDNSLNVYIAGVSSSTNGIATAGAYQTVYAGSNDAFLAKFNSLGNQIWSTYFGGPSWETLKYIKTDNSKNIYMCGESQSYSGIASANAFQTNNMGGRDAYLCRFDSAGHLVWSTYFGNTNDDYSYHIFIKDSNLIYLTGATYSNTGIATSGALQIVFGGTTDAYLARFNASGQRVWATYYGGTGIDVGIASVMDYMGNLYLGGTTTSATGIASGNAYQTSLNSAEDMFLAKIGADTFRIAPTFNDTLFCAGDTFSIGYEYNLTAAPYLDTFTALLSDNSGSFTNAQAIGQSFSATSSTLFCTIPINAMGGTGYRIKIAAKNPIDTTEQNGFNIHIKAIPYHHVRSLNPCTGDTLRFFDSVLNCSLIRWSGPNLFSSTIANPIQPSASLIDSGNYYVTDSFTNGCKVSDTLHVNIYPQPAKPIVMSNSPICVGDSLFFYAMDSTNGVAWTWTGANSFNSSLQNPIRTGVTPADSGLYLVKAHLGNCYSIADTLHVVVNPNTIPALTITANSSVKAGILDTFHATFSNCSNPVYSWYINGSLVPGANAATFTGMLQAGQQLTCHVHCSGACYSPDSAISNSLSTVGISNIATSSIIIYPNPVESELVIEGAEGGSVNIYDVVGRLVYTNAMMGKPESIITGAWDRGTYIVELVLPDGFRIVRKVVK